LVKKKVCNDIAQADAKTGDNETSAFVDFHNEYYIEDRDSACKEVSFNSSDHIHFEYHIVYNVSYSVPVLYFQATKTDGQSLLLEEVWERVPRSHRDALEGKWSFITQTDHPILGHPVFHIHPCNTATMMRNLLTGELDVKGHQYLLMWLSALGPLVGLEVQNELFVDKQM